MAPVVFLILIMIITPFSKATGYVKPCDTATDFIRTNCNTTTYSQLCCQYLASSSKSIKTNPSQIIRVAIIVSRTFANELLNQFGNLTLQSKCSTDNSTLKSCIDHIHDSMGSIGDSMEQMLHLAGPIHKLLFKLGNVQTWMSAAMTNVDTCQDENENLTDEQLKSNVLNGTSMLTELISNALALVNRYADKVKNMAAAAP